MMWRWWCLTLRWTSRAVHKYKQSLPRRWTLCVCTSLQPRFRRPFARRASVFRQTRAQLRCQDLVRGVLRGFLKPKRPQKSNLFIFIVQFNNRISYSNVNCDLWDSSMSFSFAHWRFAFSKICMGCFWCAFGSFFRVRPFRKYIQVVQTIFAGLFALCFDPEKVKKLPRSGLFTYENSYKLKETTAGL